MKFQETLDFQNNPQDLWDYLKGAELLVLFDREYDYWQNISRDFHIPVEMFTSENSSESRILIQKSLPILFELFPSGEWHSKMLRLQNYFNS